MSTRKDVFGSILGGDVEHFRELVEEHGPNLKIDYTSPALFLCATMSLAMTKILVEAGADVNTVCQSWDSSETPLYLAAFEKHHDIALYLISQGANVNAIISKGRTIMHILCQFDDQLATIKVLLATGKVDETIRDDEGRLIWESGNTQSVFVRYFEVRATVKQLNLSEDIIKHILLFI